MDRRDFIRGLFTASMLVSVVPMPFMPKRKTHTQIEDNVYKLEANQTFEFSNKDFTLEFWCNLAPPHKALLTLHNQGDDNKIIKWPSDVEWGTSLGPPSVRHDNVIHIQFDRKLREA